MVASGDTVVVHHAEALAADQNQTTLQDSTHNTVGKAVSTATQPTTYDIHQLCDKWTGSFL